MKIIVPTNNKGGIGKTKVSLLLAEYFSKICNKKVLAIDFDPQCNFSRRFLKMEVDPTAKEGFQPPIHPDYDINDIDDNGWNGRSSIADIFFSRPVYPYPTHIPNLDIAPAHASNLLMAEMQTRSEIVDRVHYQLHAFLNGTDVKENYDVVIVDTAPSKGPLTISAIKAASHLIIPVVMEAQPIQGIFGMLQVWMQESLNREKDRSLDLIGILPNMFLQNTTLHKDMLDSLKQNPQLAKYILPVKLARRIVYAEVDSVNASPQSIFDMKPTEIARMEAEAFCRYVELQVFGHE